MFDDHPPGRHAIDLAGIGPDKRLPAAGDDEHLEPAASQIVARALTASARRQWVSPGRGCDGVRKNQPQELLA